MPTKVKQEALNPASHLRVELDDLEPLPEPLSAFAAEQTIQARELYEGSLAVATSQRSLATHFSRFGLFHVIRRWLDMLDMITSYIFIQRKQVRKLRTTQVFVCSFLAVRSQYGWSLAVLYFSTFVHLATTG